jgi:GNAT superfamily N-acetyltransferase
VTTDSIEVKRATWEDEQILADLYRAATEERGDTNLQLVFDGVRYALQNDDAVYLAFDGDRPVGVVAWTHTPLAAEGAVVGFGTYVVPQYRRQGIQRRLRAAATDHCRQKHYKTVEGVVSENNVAGLQSALDDGFEVVGYLVRKTL